MEQHKEKTRDQQLLLEKVWDFVIIGTSPIGILEAAHHKANGKSVLLIDNKPRIGGSWCPLNIFGLHNVENAIHYFLPDKTAFEFMAKVLFWKVVVSERKYRMFNKSIFGIDKLKYDNLFGRLFCQFFYTESDKGIFHKLFSVFEIILKSPRRKSYYVKGGTAEIMRSIRNIVSKFDLNILLSTQINHIEVAQEEKLVKVGISDTNGTLPIVLNSHKIILTHGSQLKKIDSNSNKFEINNKIHPRPAVHLLVNDTSITNINELIFMNHPLIKYVHDVTSFCDEAESMIGKTKILVFALQHSIDEYDGIYNDLVNACKASGIIGKEASLNQAKWWEIFLPSLEDSDLIEIVKRHHPFIEWLSTENFSRGIGLNSERWSTSLKKNK